MDQKDNDAGSTDVNPSAAADWLPGFSRWLTGKQIIPTIFKSKTRRGLIQQSTVKQTPPRMGSTLHQRRLKSRAKQDAVNPEGKDKTMKRQFTILAAIGLLMIGMGGTAEATVLDFEAHYSVETGGFIPEFIEEDGFQLNVSSGYWASLPGNASPFASNGTVTLVGYNVNNDSNGSIINLSSVGGSPFSIQSIDLAELIAPGEVAMTAKYEVIQFEGQKADGAILHDSFTLDGIVDGPGGVDDFQTHYFSSDWFDLMTVSLIATYFTSPDDSTNSHYSFDNIIVNEDAVSVPEPAAMLLLGTGLVGLAGRGCKSIRKKTSG